MSLIGEKENTVASEQIVSSFRELHLAVRGNVEIIPSTEEKVVIEGDDESREWVQIVNTGRSLYVTSKGKFWKSIFGNLRVKVYLREIDSLSVQCHGNVLGAGPIVSHNDLKLKIFTHGHVELDLRTPSLDANIASHGNITLRGECFEANITNASHGNIDCEGLQASHIRLLNMGHGNVDIRGDKTVTIRNMGHGEIRYHGAGTLEDIQQFGHGTIYHVD